MLSSLSFHYSLLSIGSVSAGDEPFICGGRAFICESSGTVPAGGTDAGTEEDNSGKKQVRVHKHADYLGTCTEIYCTHQHPHAWRTYCVSASRHETSCLFRGVEKMHTSVKIDTCRCSHLESLWDTGGRLFLLSVWWATGRHGPAWTHRRGAPGPEEGGVAGG